MSKTYEYTVSITLKDELSEKDKPVLISGLYLAIDQIDSLVRGDGNRVEESLVQGSRYAGRNGQGGMPSMPRQRQ